MKELFSGVWCSDSAICSKDVMPQDVAWHYLNISIHHLAAEVKLTSNQRNQKSTVFLFSKAVWRKSSSQHCRQVKIRNFGENCNGEPYSFYKAPKLH